MPPDTVKIQGTVTISCWHDILKLPWRSVRQVHKYNLQCKMVAVFNTECRDDLPIFYINYPSQSYTKKEDSKEDLMILSKYVHLDGLDRLLLTDGSHGTSTSLETGSSKFI